MFGVSLASESYTKLDNNVVLLTLTIESDLQAVVQALQILSSPNEANSKIAKEELRVFVWRTTQDASTAELTTRYLSASNNPWLDHLSYSSHSSLWSRVRKACRRQHIIFVFSDTEPAQVSADQKTPSNVEQSRTNSSVVQTRSKTYLK